MIPVIAEILGAIVALIVGVVSIRELMAAGYRPGLLLLAILCFAAIPLLLRRALQIVKEVRALLEDMDH
jgi:TRAP-type C4-dicarboxylate transport system permease large subunit